MKISANIVILIGLFLAGMGFQVFLSKREDKISGLVLPILSFINSLIRIIGLMGYGLDKKDMFTASMTILVVFNIPSLIFLVIYFLCRKNKTLEKEIEKMNIQDLE